MQHALWLVHIVNYQVERRGIMALAELLVNTAIDDCTRDWYGLVVPPSCLGMESRIHTNQCFIKL